MAKAPAVGRIPHPSHVRRLAEVKVHGDLDHLSPHLALHSAQQSAAVCTSTEPAKVGWALGLDRKRKASPSRARVEDVVMMHVRCSWCSGRNGSRPLPAIESDTHGISEMLMRDRALWRCTLGPTQTACATSIAASTSRPGTSRQLMTWSLLVFLLALRTTKTSSKKSHKIPMVPKLSFHLASSRHFARFGSCA